MKIFICFLMVLALSVAGVCQEKKRVKIKVPDVYRKQVKKIFDLKKTHEVNLLGLKTTSQFLKHVLEAGNSIDQVKNGAMLVNADVNITLIGFESLKTEQLKLLNRLKKPEVKLTDEEKEILSGLAAEDFYSGQAETDNALKLLKVADEFIKKRFP